jgi:hypothetical protein
VSEHLNFSFIFKLKPSDFLFSVDHYRIKICLNGRHSVSLLCTLNIIYKSAIATEPMFPVLYIYLYYIFSTTIAEMEWPKHTEKKNII